MTKIRLIRNDGEVLVVDSTGYSMNMTRSVPVLPVPMIGERWAIDLNMVTADFKIDVILADDDCAASSFVKVGAKAKIDFSAVAEQSSGSRAIYMIGDGGTVEDSHLHDLYFEIDSSYTGSSSVIDPIRIQFDNTTLVHVVSNTPPTVHVGIQGIATGADLALAIKTACDAAIFTTDVTAAGGKAFADAFTIALGVGYWNILGLAQLTITQVVKGTDGNNQTPVFPKSFSTFSTIPLYQEFSAGKEKNCRSAGDKLQDLIAYVGNASLTGASGRALGGPTDPDDPAAVVESNISLATNQTADYIVGIQIPYNSIITSTISDTDYVERNLLIISGRTNAEDQDSTANTFDVSTPFNPKHPYTGIAGTVVSMAFSYIAGENVYEGSLTFMPIDFIAGS